MATKEQIVTHTPGPWLAEYDEDESGHVVWLGEDVNPSNHETHLRWVCEHSIWPEAGASEAKQFAEAEANARLIAAAPDLLDVARTIVAICESGNVEHARLACDENSPLVDAARAAIAKAEGRS